MTDEKPNGRPKGFKMSAATKAKLARAMRRRWRAARKQGNTGKLTAANGTVNGHVRDKNIGRKTGKSEVIELAKVGARIRLTELEREATKLRIFLGDVK